MKRTILLSIACLSMSACKSNDQIQQKPIQQKSKKNINAHAFLKELRTSLINGELPQEHIHRFDRLTQQLEEQSNRYSDAIKELHSEVLALFAKKIVAQNF